MDKDAENDIKLQQYKQRLMLHSYQQQLSNARRLARHKVRMRIAEGLNPDDPDPSFRHRQFASKVAQELYDSLLFYPLENPIMEEIRDELSQILKKQVEFTYPPGGTLRIYVRENGQARALTSEEQQSARDILLRLTQKNVREKMPASAIGISTGT